MVESFHSYSKPGTRFHRCSTIFFDPTLENTSKPSLTKKTLWSEIPSGQLKLVECKFSQTRRNLQLLTEFWGGRDTFCITGCCRGPWKSICFLLVFLICRCFFHTVSTSATDGSINL
ncbi:hypothetical protein V8G54_020774 [Vigna mungo]|uniref:Uncharacterized protein n=1 Tax=Vigna mungo TaxID=3915 RepID=A0AAQ3RW75_VIGMU